MPLKLQYIPAKEHTPAVPLGNFDIQEDEHILVNRLYYAIPDFRDGQFSCSFFYEENTFRKEPNGDLTLLYSEYGIENSSAPEFPANT